MKLCICRKDNVTPSSIEPAAAHFRMWKSSPTSLVARTSITTIPIGVDDINSINNIEILAVQFFNGAALSTVSEGSNCPCTMIILTANKTFAESTRYIHTSYVLKTLKP